MSNIVMDTLKEKLSAEKKYFESWTKIIDEKERDLKKAEASQDECRERMVDLIRGIEELEGEN